MVAIKIEVVEGWQSVTTCPFLLGSSFMVGSKYCTKCKFHVNKEDNLVWCIGDEHPCKNQEKEKNKTMEKKNTVTIEQVKANMEDVKCTTITLFDKPCTYVEVRMKNGFTVRETTTCVDPANYSEEIGKEICLKRIEDKIWMLLGFELASRLNGSALD